DQHGNSLARDCHVARTACSTSRPCSNGRLFLSSQSSGTRHLTYKPIAKACKKLNDKDCNFIIIANSTVGKCYIESPDHVNHIKEIASKNTENKIGLLIDPSKFEIKNYLISLPFIKNLI
ncbi:MULTISPECIES: hypothetical protein, partial [Comamonas]|uniref:hypothetical protein n=1 Tax=Comamonas TaxID=283 RepID=UPI00237EDAC8